MEKRLLGGSADCASSRLVEQANICVGLKRRYFFGTIQHFRRHVWLYLHIDFGVRVRSTFQHGGSSLPAPPLGGVLGGAAFSLVFCCVVLLGLLLWAVFLVGLLFPCLLLGGAAWPPPLGAVAFFLFFSVVLPSFPSFGWVFPSLQLGGAAGTPPSLGRGALRVLGCWGVGVLGGWVGCSGVGRFGVACCVLVGFGVGVGC